MNNILEDIKKKLNIEFTNEDIHEFKEGKSEAKVFSICDKYLIKCSNEYDLNVIETFLSKEDNKYFQKLYYVNHELGYACLSFLPGKKYDNSLDIDYYINTVYDITSNYKKIDYEGFGYFNDDHKTWEEFLLSELDYSNSIVKNEELDDSVVRDAIKIISKYKVEPFLLHGDFGIHNFIINDNKLYVIDPMGVVGDPLYDFYFAIFSDISIFNSIKLDDILRYFDRNIKYKRELAYITFIIRLCRTYKYNKDDYNVYIKYLENNEDTFVDL
jgi:hypothetical protein